MVKIRLQRHGRKGKPFYMIVVADARAPRDGKFIEKIGSYNPNTDPATVLLNSEKALEWLNNGAQPTDTAKAILRYKGVLFQKYLDNGVKKGVLTPEQAETKMAEFNDKREGQIQAKRDKLASGANENRKKVLELENKVAKNRLIEIAKKNTPVVEEVAEEVAETTEEVVEQVTEVAETTTQEVAAEVTETVAEVVESNGPAAEEAAGDAATEEKAE